MAKIQFPSIIESVSGKMGGFVVRRSPSGAHYISAAPGKSKVKASAAQHAHRQRFKEASAYARAALADPTVAQVYRQAAQESNKTAYNLAVSDYLKGINLLHAVG
jgi:hypothetical protein